MKQTLRSVTRLVNRLPFLKEVFRCLMRRIPNRTTRYKIRCRVEKQWDDEVHYSQRGFYYPNKSEIGIGADEFGVHGGEIPVLIQRYLHNPKVIIEVGGNIGIDSRQIAASVSKECRIIVFEPAPMYNDILRRNVANAKNVEIHDYFVGAQSGGRALLHINSNSASPVYNASRSFPTLKTLETRTISLDDFISAHGIAAVDFIKTDTDGNDHEVIKGATRTIRRFHPSLFVEFSGYHLEARGSSNAQLAELLETLGYHTFLVFQGHNDAQPSEVRGRADLCRVLSRDSSANVFTVN